MEYKLTTPDETRIGWVGTGVMGLSMCRNLMEAGYQATIFSRTKAKAQTLLDAGATWADSPREVAEASDVSFAIVGMPEDVHSVFLGDEGLLAGASAGSIVVDMTTSKPELAVRIDEAAKAKSVAAIDAPVSGGDVGAKSGALSIMIGGEADAVAAVQPLFDVMGKTVVHQGPAGSGQHTKMVNQILVAAGMLGVCESLLYALKSGLDLQTVLKSVSSGAAGSWALSNLGPRIIEGNFDPGFFVEHFVKDLNIAFEESSRMGLKLRGLELARELYIELEKAGFGKDGTQALQKTLARDSGFEWPS
ncbi:NAD(P)-dependent oxidoreductase [Mariniblastus fucicola]|uniref:2-hydroxy-3-oxopropionate reductase n=1 Tax=Mariniblastus fucicola TaxID=980251 RepID=A0A5B9PG56_9BACT|nr:NAD(P)-dependent oxidoreductase [Mariniblastus fucicola]QEG24220.1 2-hydroxy-3-oxopropionate reductase [Mariniblastus fucicola]